MSFRPLLGEKLGDIKKGRTVEADLAILRLPLYGSFKLDGWRGGWETLEFMTRHRKTIPNRNLQAMFSRIDLPTGWDGEIIVGDPYGDGVFKRTDKFCKAQLATTPLPIRFFVFDNYEAPGGFSKRLETLYDIHPLVVKLDQILLDTVADVLALEAKALALGYEGLVLRDPEGRYKQGRSTLREQYLLKLKRFIRFQATVTGFNERMHNANEAFDNELGYTKRSSHQENKIPMNTLGSLNCINDAGVEFSVSGFTAAMAKEIWTNQNKYLGKRPWIKSFPIGQDKAPRQPQFISWPE